MSILYIYVIHIKYFSPLLLSKMHECINFISSFIGKQRAYVFYISIDIAKSPISELEQFYLHYEYELAS